MEAITVRVLNWAKYNPRTDRKKHTWFRLENGIPDSQGMHGLGADQCWAWVVLLAEASKNQGEAFELDLEWWASRARTTLERVRDLLKRCVARKMIEVFPPDGYQLVTSGNQSVSDGITTDGRTDGREDSNESSSGPAEPALPAAAPAASVKPLKKPRKRIEPVAFETEAELLGAISEDQHRHWAELYPDREYVARKIKTAWGYYHIAKTKPEPTTLPGWVRALNKWLEGDWAKHVAGVPARATVTPLRPPDRTQMLAVRFVAAVKKYGEGDPGVAEFLTADELAIYRKVGRRAIANLQDNEHGRRSLLGMINAALAPQPDPGGAA